MAFPWLDLAQRHTEPHLHRQTGLDRGIATVRLVAAFAEFVPPAEQAAVASALLGDKAALAFSRIDSATLCQASQDITDFGVAVSDQDAEQIRTAGDAIDRLGLVWLGLTNQLTVAVAPAPEVVANALADATRAGGLFQTSISFLGDHIGEIASIAAAFATFFAGRFIIALGAAALGVSGFSLSLTVLKGALIRTGIGALIVGAGELVYQFSKLVEGAGGFGAALGLLSDLASEVWDRIGLGVDAVVASLTASWSGITATWPRPCRARWWRGWALAIRRPACFRGSLTRSRRSGRHFLRRLAISPSRPRTV